MRQKSSSLPDTPSGTPHSIHSSLGYLPCAAALAPPPSPSLRTPPPPSATLSPQLPLESLPRTPLLLPQRRSPPSFHKPPPESLARVANVLHRHPTAQTPPAP